MQKRRRGHPPGIALLTAGKPPSMEPTSVGWPSALWLVRHGESEGNVANDLARRDRLLRLDINTNDPDVSLSDTGAAQARALGTWIAHQPPDEHPAVAVVSPYVRASETARIALEHAGLTSIPVHFDERLRDREQGVLDRLTSLGLRERYPEEADRREYLGKFWFRPSGGESWADVALRVRAALLDIRLAWPNQRVLIVTHDVTILIFRYILERLTPAEAVALSGQVHNCSVTRYDAQGDRLELSAFSDTTALDQDDRAPVTAHD